MQTEKGKPTVRWGRKATDLLEVAELPKVCMMKRVILMVMLAIIGVMCVAWIKAAAAQAADIQATMYASPNGRGSLCSQASPCSLVGARDKVGKMNANMSGDIIVNLRGGTYELSAPFELTNVDSGTNGHDVVYKSYPGETPVFSGGEKVTGWSLHDRAKGIYRAKVDPSLQTRQLYVNGKRAIRARSTDNPGSFTKTSVGYTTTNTNMQNWSNISDIEFVDFAKWKSFRCGVSNISGNAITMKQPCWRNTQNNARDIWDMGLPTWIENAYPLLDQPGEWYLDRSTDYLYYKPRAGESMSTATFIAPRLETLVSGTGTFDQPIHNIQLRGIKFSYATWLRPNTSDGHASQQAGFAYVGNHVSTKMPANVTFHTAKSIRLERNVFSHLGGTALVLEWGSQNNAVVGNRFEDISGGGVSLGDASGHPGDPRNVTKNNEVSNNVITGAGAEYFDTAGIWAGYTDSSRISHNELSDLPYSGISVGWGWGGEDPGGSLGYTTPTPARNNMIDHNRINDYSKVLKDAGGIYALGAQPGSKITDNYVSRQIHNRAAIYLDQGTQFYTVNHNVAAQTPMWLLLWHHDSIRNNTVQYNYTNNMKGSKQSIPIDTANRRIRNNTVNNNTFVQNRNWPAEAREIINNAGVTAAYQNR